MADVLVVLVTMVFFIQITLIGFFTMLSATYTNMGTAEAQRADPYQPMRILTERAQQKPAVTPEVPTRAAA